MPGRQNQTVFLLPPDLTFRFRVFFDNLTDGELGALLFSLDLSRPPSWDFAGDAPLFHAIGHGTRLGMGRCSITVQQVHVDEMDSQLDSARYRRLGAVRIPVTPSDAGRSSAARVAFSDAWKHLTSLREGVGEEYQTIVREIADMMRIVDGPVHYPNHWDPEAPSGTDYFDSFTWFVANKRGSSRSRRQPGMHRLPSPLEESSGDERLPTDPSRSNSV
jgi:hypothetical protein